MTKRSLNNRVGRMLSGIPGGYMIGRLDKGEGQAQLITPEELRRMIGPGWVRSIASTALTVQDEGTPQSTTVNTLNFVGAGVVASGAGTTETITIPGYTDEQAQDAIGTILTNTATIAWTYDDAGNKIKADVIGAGASSDLATAILADGPTGYWKCTEASGTVVDYSGGGFDLTASVGTLVYQHSVLLPKDSTKFLEFNSTTACVKTTTGLGLTYPLSGDWTVECIFNPAATGATLSGPRTFFSIDGGASETQANNCQIEFGISAAGGFQVRWESGLGVERVTASPLGGTASIQSNHPYHLAAVKDSAAGKISFYVNGRLQDIATAYPANTDGGTGTMVTYIGANGETATVARTIVGHVAFFSGKKLTDAQIYAHASAAGLTW